MNIVENAGPLCAPVFDFEDKGRVTRHQLPIRILAGARIDHWSRYVTDIVPTVEPAKLFHCIQMPLRIPQAIKERFGPIGRKDTLFRFYRTTELQ